MVDDEIPCRRHAIVESLPALWTTRCPSAQEPLSTCYAGVEVTTDALAFSQQRTGMVCCKASTTDNAIVPSWNDGAAVSYHLALIHSQAAEGADDTCLRTLPQMVVEVFFSADIATGAHNLFTLTSHRMLIEVLQPNEFSTQAFKHALHLAISQKVL